MKRIKFFPFALLLLSSLVVFSCTDDPTSPTLNPPIFGDNVPDPFDIDDIEPVEINEGILKYIYYTPSENLPIEVVLRDQIRIHMTLRTESGEKIYSTFQNNNNTAIVFTVNNFRPGFPLTYGSQQAFTDGLRKGVLGMKEGEKSVLIVPPELGFQDIREGSLNEPYRHETLRYDIELFEIID